MKKLIAIQLVIVVLLTTVTNNSFAQGCVAVRSNGAMCTRSHADTAADSHNWQLTTGYRYFHSFRHFVGTQEQKQRVAEGTDVRNFQHAVDFTLVRKLNSRMSLAVNMPIISNRRSSMYEHYGNTSTNPNARRETSSFGIGDIRITAYRWMLDPLKSRRGNIQVGLGLKLPTGDYRYNDFFWKNDSTKVLGPVDQSIQLGDGGTGISLELNGYYVFTKELSAYGNFYYLSNPREQNGVSTARGGTTTNANILYGSSVMSVPDQYMVRGGLNVMVGAFSASAGIRLEAIPSEDLIGGSSGFRRPGRIFGAEPGVAYQLKKVNLFATVPYWFSKNRTQSYADKMRTKATGVFTQGDAAFSDYSINIGCTVKF
jgi:hypothetical protein